MAEKLRSWIVYWEVVHTCAHKCACVHTHAHTRTHAHTLTRLHIHTVCNHLHSDLHSDHHAVNTAPHGGQIKSLWGKRWGLELNMEPSLARP